MEEIIENERKRKADCSFFQPVSLGSIAGGACDMQGYTQMKGFIEEYGTLMLAVITGLALLLVINSIMIDDGSFRQMAMSFFQALGMVQG